MVELVTKFWQCPPNVSFWNDDFKNKFIEPVKISVLTFNLLWSNIKIYLQWVTSTIQYLQSAANSLP